MKLIKDVLFYSAGGFAFLVGFIGPIVLCVYAVANNLGVL